jgi:GntR family transcriptional regulator, transcriptional repressor for pyruvate dehydrogenase complex
MNATEKSLFAPLEKKRSFDEISNSIKELILDGTLKIGDRLPSEKDLAQQFQVGRQTIREALRLLELSGFVTIQRGPGGGPVIKDTILRRIGDLFTGAFRMRHITIEALTQARLEIERSILRFVFQNADQQDIKALKENVKSAEKRISGGRMGTEYNADFHTLLAKATKNDVFVIVMESIMAVHLDLLSRTGADLDTSREVVRGHGRLVEAIEAGDQDLAYAVLDSHVVEVKERLNAISDNKKRQ